MVQYKEQLFFEHLGVENQKILRSKVVCIVGIGALGTNTAELLARTGVMELILIDRDFIEEDNLQKQALFTKNDINKMKVEAAKSHLGVINPELKITIHQVDLDFDNIDLLKSDLILDCTDNMYTRFLINEYHVKTKTPWIYSSAIGSSGYVKVFNKLSSACFSCIFQEPTSILGTCDTEGLLNTTARTISSIQVTEAIKVLTKQDYSKDLIYIDLWKNKFNKIKVKKNNECKACKKEFKYLTGTNSPSLIKLCGTNKYLIRTKKYNLEELENKLKNLGETERTDSCLFFNGIVIFKDGRVMLKAKDEANAKSIISRYLE